jgi:hypothetical protein
VPIPTNSSHYHFERNYKPKNGWFDHLLTALSSSKETSLAWLLKSLAKVNNEDFIVAAEGTRFFLNGKELDAESAIVMWEEANCNLSQQ